MPQVCYRLVETPTTACMPRCARPELLHGENRFTGNSGTVKISLKFGNVISVLHCFEKKTRQTEKKDTNLIVKRFKATRNRYKPNI